MKFLPVLLSIWLALFAADEVWANTAGRVLLATQYEKFKADNKNRLTNPLLLHSAEQGRRLRADVYSEVQHPFEQVTQVLQSPARWCDFMPLNLNIKACLYQTKGRVQHIIFYAGRKFYQAPDEAKPLQYTFNVAQRATDYVRVVLEAEAGPYGTRDYNITVQAMPLGNGTLIHVHSAYTTSFWSRMGTGIYLSTLGSDKEGFTITGYDKNDQPRYIKGVKGIIERNTIRYYISLRALLDSSFLPPQKQFAYQLNTCFDMTEQYKRQLHELDKDEYLSAKQRERQNQIELQNRITGNDS